MSAMEYPWQSGVLKNWSICGMNHYHVNGVRFLFVSMTKDGLCITEEGKDDEYIWNRLWHKATDAESNTTDHPLGERIYQAYEAPNGEIVHARKGYAMPAGYKKVEL